MNKEKLFPAMLNDIIYKYIILQLCLVAWLFKESETGVDLVLIETCLLL